MQSNGSVAHLAVELVLRDEGGDGVDHDQVDGSGTDEGFGDVKCVLAAFGLRDHKVVEIDADRLSIAGIKRVFDVDEDGVATLFLSLGYRAQAESCLAGAFGAVDFADTTAG